MEYYLTTVQYITVTILLPRNFDPNFVLELSSDAAMIQQGTVFARTSTINSNTLQYKLVNDYNVQISGFSTIPSGSLITVTMRVWINTNPIFNIFVKIDTLAHINANAPIISGTSSATVSATP
jgi:acetyltransferase-like isoleucine patch superfamily enzyme